MYSFEEAGLLGLVQSIVGIVAFTTSPLLVYFEPKIYRQKLTNSLESLRSFVKTGLALTLSLSIVAVSAGTVFISYRYSISIREIIVPLACFALVPVFNIYNLALNVQSARKESTADIIIPAMIMPFTVVTVGLALIPTLGVLGASCAMLSGSFLQALYCWNKLEI